MGRKNYYGSGALLSFGDEFLTALEDSWVLPRRTLESRAECRRPRPHRKRSG